MFFPSFRQKPECSEFNMFWMPDQVRHDDFETFYKFIMLYSVRIDWIPTIYLKEVAQ